MSKKLEIALIISAVDRATRIMNVVTYRAVKNLKSVQDASQKLSDRSADVSRKTFIAGAAIAAPLFGATKAAAEFEDKMADVAKVMNLQVGSNEFIKMGDEAKDLAVYLSKMPEDAAGLMAALASGGVAKKDLAEVSKIAGEMAVAFNIGSEFGGEQFIKTKNAMGATIDQTKKLMDSINFLSDNDASKASQILDFMSAGGAGVANTMKVAGPQMSAFGSTLISMGKSGAEAATIMERFQKGVFKNQEMNAIFQKAGGGAQGLMAILEKGAKLSGQQQFAYFNEFGEYGVNIMQMAQNLPHLQDNIRLVAKEQNYLGSVTKEFNNRNSTTIGQFNQLKAGAMVAAIELGNTLLPVIVDLIREVKPLIKSATDWIKNNRELVGTIMKVAAAISAVLIATSGVSAVISGVSTAVSLFSGGLGSLLSAGRFLAPILARVASASWAFTASLLANPIGAIIAAVVAVIAAITILVIKWKDITAWFKKTHWAVKLLLAPLISAFAPIIAIAFAIRKVIDNWGAIKTFFGGLIGYVDQIPDKFYNAGKNIVTSLWKGIKSVAKMPVDAISNITKSMRDYLPFSPAKKGAFMDLHKVKIVETIAAAMRPAPLVSAMATATSSAMGGKGKAGASASGGGGSIVINYNPTINVSGSGGDIKAALKENADYLMKLIDQKLANKKRTAF